MLRWEQEHLADNGVLSNSELFDVVEAVSYFKSAHMEDGRG